MGLVVGNRCPVGPPSVDYHVSAGRLLFAQFVGVESPRLWIRTHEDPEGVVVTELGQLVEVHLCADCGCLFGIPRARHDVDEETR